MLFHPADAARRPLDAPAAGWRHAIQGSNLTALASELKGRVRITPLASAPFQVRVHALERPNVSILVVASEDSYRIRRQLERHHIALAYADFARSLTLDAGASLAPCDMLFVRGGALDARVRGKSGIVVIDLDLRAFPDIRAIVPRDERATLRSGNPLATMRLRRCVRAIASMCAPEHASVGECVMRRVVECELVACVREAMSASSIVTAASSRPMSVFPHSRLATTGSRSRQAATRSDMRRSEIRASDS